VEGSAGGGGKNILRLVPVENASAGCKKLLKVSLTVHKTDGYFVTIPLGGSPEAAQVVGLTQLAERHSIHYCKTNAH
jgi:hypothetical protein